MQILFICSSNFSSEYKVIPSNFLLKLDAIYVLSKRIYICVFELKPLSAEPIKLWNTFKQFVGCCRWIVSVCLIILWGWHLKAKDNITFFRIRFRMIIFATIENVFSNCLKFRNYRWYILCKGIGSSVISVAGSFIILKFKKQVNHIILNSSGPNTIPCRKLYLISLLLL